MLVSRALNRLERSINGARYYRQSSSPFISPDTFKNYCDLDLDNIFIRNKHEIENASVIFCNSGRVQEFFDSYSRQINASVLIFGNNDVDFKEFNFKIPKSVRRIYLQNSVIHDPFFRTIPIGIENLKFLTNGLPHLFADHFSKIDKQAKLLVGPFGKTHPERIQLLSQEYVPNEFIEIQSSRLRPRKYAKISSSFKFIACPRGNGLDTHRFWETLYRGSLPVVIASKWSQHFLNLGVPLVEVSSWDEAFFLFENQMVEKIDFNPKNIGPLWDSYWLDLIHKDIS